MVVLQGFHWWIGNHDMMLWEWQGAYTENLFIKNPEFLCLWQKSQNLWELTEDDIVCTQWIWLFFWTKWGKVRDFTTGALKWTLWTNAITNMFLQWSTIYVGRTPTSLASISISDATWWTQWESTGSYNSSFVWTWCNKFQQISSNVHIFSSPVSNNYTIGKIDTGISSSIYTILDNNQNWVWLWFQWTDLRVVWWKGNLLYWDWVSENWSVKMDWNWLLWAWHMVEWLSLIIWWWRWEDNTIYSLDWITKNLLARSDSSWNIEWAKRFYMWRSELLESVYPNSRYWGNDIMTGNWWNVYMIWYDWIYSFSQPYRWMSYAWNVETTKNYNNEVVDQIGMVYANESSTWVSRLYYSWKTATKHWVDYLELSNQEPTLFMDQWAWYTQRFNFGGKKAKIQWLECRAYTTATQTIKIYVAINWWSYTLVDTLDSTDPKLYKLINKHYEAYDIQFKFELETDDDTKTPKLHSFKFDPKIIDG